MLCGICGDQTARDKMLAIVFESFSRCQKAPTKVGAFSFAAGIRTLTATATCLQVAVAILSVQLKNFFHLLRYFLQKLR